MDPCLLIYNKRRIIILIHVDNILITISKLKDVLWFKRELAKFFKIKDLGEPEKILGMRITRDREQGTLKLDQGHYVQENLSKMNHSKEKAYPTHSPIDSSESLKLSSSKDGRCDKLEYQSHNGTWMWPATMTRPDIAFCIGRLSSYVSNPLKEHMKALKKLGRYLRSYPDLGIMFRRGGNSKL